MSSPVPSSAMTCAENSVAYVRLRKTSIMATPSVTAPNIFISACMRIFYL